MELMSYAIYKDGDGNTIKTAEIADKYARERIATLETNGGGTGGGTGTGEDPTEAATYAEQAKESAEQAAASAEAAATSEANAADSAEAAETAASTATDEADRALACANEANAAAQVSGTDKTEAAASAEAAEAAETAAKAAQSAAEAAKTEAQGAADSASESKTAAAASAATAASKATEAGNSATSAANAKTAAESAQNAAETAANTASQQAGFASGFADDAITARDEAQGFKGQAATSATEAADSATTATEQAGYATNSAHEALQGANQANASAEAAAASETNAAASATEAAEQAEEASSSRASAYSFMQNASVHADNAAASKNAAAASADAAADSAAEAKAAAASVGASGYTVPDYWTDEVDATVNAINALHEAGGGHCVTFAFFSDSHSRFGCQGDIIAAVLDRTNSSFSFFGGDAVNNGTIEAESGITEDLTAFDALMAPVPAEKDCRTIGNHDGMRKTAAGLKYNWSMAKTFDKIFRRTEWRERHYGGDGTFYYVEDKASRVRFIVLNSMWWSYATNSDGTSLKNTNGFGAEQIKWLAEEALHFDHEGWNVVFISHAPLCNERHSFLRDGGIVQEVLNAYKSKAKVTTTAWNGGTVSSAQVDSIEGNKVPAMTFDFTNAKTADLVGWFSGHIHTDAFWPTDSFTGAAMPLQVVTITGDMAEDYYTTSPVGDIASGTGHAIDFVTVNTETKAVNLTRCGGGSDRSYSYDEAEVYTVTKTLTHCTCSGAATATEGAAYTATVAAASGYELASVKVTMGGADITATAYSNGVVNIDNVAGDIVITATATEKAAASYTNLFDPSKAAINMRMSSSGGDSALNGYFTTDYIDVSGKLKGDGTDVFYIKNPMNTCSTPYGVSGDSSNQKILYANASKTKLSAAVLAHSDTTNFVKVSYSDGIGSFTGCKVGGSVNASLKDSVYVKFALCADDAIAGGTALTSTDQLAGVIITLNEPIE